MKLVCIIISSQFTYFCFAGLKVCNHPELFERSEGSTYLFFGEVPNSLLPPPFGELEDVHYSGGRNPIIYKVLCSSFTFPHIVVKSHNLIMRELLFFSNQFIPTFLHLSLSL